MKKVLIALALIIIAGTAMAYAQNPGSSGQGGWYCPYSEQWMEPGMIDKSMTGPCME